MPTKPLFLSGDITFENVAFVYHPSRPILRTLSFTILAGNEIAVVGPSGRGEPTVFCHLYPFYEPSARRILVDCPYACKVQLGSLRAARLALSRRIRRLSVPTSRTMYAMGG